MRLKALEMQGFKSFPDKTVLSFDRGITVIVGPNGSGKSNITDAIRWVLGEMSTKSIRGSKMEDVIFGGSDNRRPMGYAEVSLVIDNTVGIGHLESEYDEVTVTRRYYRGGESEYLINGKAARLRDIAELFMNTGVGKTGYSNIGQGKIAEIISQKSDERRSVFEEAAGISKYRYRKNEAERKLKDTEANLVRLGDIIGELSLRVGPLEKEAASARKYLDLYEQKKAVDVALWLYDAETMRSRANETERAYMAAKLSLEGADGEIGALEQKSEILYQKAASLQEENERLSEQVAVYKSKRGDLESTNRVLENDILHIEGRIEQTKAELDARRAALNEGEGQGSMLASSLVKKEEELRLLTEALSEKQTAITEKEDELALYEDDILSREAEVKEAEATLINEKVRLSALEGLHESESGRSAGLNEEIALCEEAVAQLTDSKARSEKTKEGYRNAIAEEEKQLQALLDEETALNGAYTDAKEKTARLDLTIEAKHQRIDALKRMDELLEGYHYSVKNVMHAADHGTLKGICGPVSRLIAVKPQHSLAIETALGANLQNVVTEDEASAKAAIAFLKRTGGGRATFYPITSVKAQSPSVSPADLAKHTGYIGMADTLCEYQPKYSGVIGNMLGRTAVFDTIDRAADTAKSFGYRIRIVTLDGQLVNAGGSFTGGSVKQDSGILTRSAEIENIKNEITGLTLEKEKLALLLKEKEERLSTIRTSLDGIREKTALLNTLAQAEETQCQVTESRLSTEELRLTGLRAELDGLGRERASYDKERKDLLASLDDCEKTVSEAEKALLAATEKRNAADDALYKLGEAYNALLLSKTVTEKDIEALNGNRALNESTLAALKQQITDAEQTIATLTARQESARLRMKENGRDTGTLSEDIDRLEKERQALLLKNLEYEKTQTRIREELRDKNHAREHIFREYTKLEGQREQITTEHDRLAARIWEDYELTYSAASELNYPPVTAETHTSFIAKQTELKNKIRALGHVNVGAIEEYAEVKERYDFTTAQFEDLTKARESLDGVIERLEREMKTRFTTAVEEINKNFKVTFRELFGGGNAEISLTDPENVLTSGIEINVAPPGKIIKNLISLSGGEQAFVAIALIFAILNVNPTPFCIFDEIESALDEVNVVRLSDYMRRYSEKTQFVAITHRRGTMEASDMLYGITMPDRGISKVLSMNVNEVEQKMGGKLN